MFIASSFFGKTALCAVFAFVLTPVVFAQKAKPTAPKPKQTAGPKVTQIDVAGLKKLLKPNGKPLLINFWATWCDPCREEFPDLVKLDSEFKGRVDFITVSLDDLDNITTLVPKFLNGVKAKMPAYLLKTPDENAAISLVSTEWSGELPLTAIYEAGGALSYFRPGPFKYQTLRDELARVVAKPISTPSGNQPVLALPR